MAIKPKQKLTPAARSELARLKGMEKASLAILKSVSTRRKEIMKACRPAA